MDHPYMTRDDMERRIAILEAELAATKEVLSETEVLAAKNHAAHSDFAARCAVLAGALEKAAILDIGRQIPGPRDDREIIDAVRQGHDEARAFVKVIARQALSDLPEAAQRIVAVVEALRGNTEFEPWWERYGGMIHAAHYINVWVRVNGKDEEFEADWLRDTAKALAALDKGESDAE